MRQKKTGFILTLLVLVCVPVFAQEQSQKFRHVAFAKELGQITRHGILEDDEGFIWLSANNRLLRYDGKSTTSFWFRDVDIDPRRASWINATSRTSDGTIWIATRCGLAKLAPHDNCLRYVTDEAPNRALIYGKGITTVLTDKDNHVWFVTGNALHRLTPESHELETIIPGDDKLGSIAEIRASALGSLWVFYRNGWIAKKDVADRSFQFINIHDIATLNPDGLKIRKAILHNETDALVATAQGLLQINFRERKARPITGSAPMIEFTEDKRARALEKHCYDENKIWVGTVKDGLYLLDLTTGKSEHFVHRSDRSESLLSDNIYALKNDRRGKLWIASERGYSVINPATGINYTPISHYGIKPFPRGLRAMAKDQLGRMWYGSETNSLIVRSQSNKPIATIKSFSAPKRPLPMRQIALPDASGGMWFSVYNKGLVHIDGETFVPRHYDLGIIPDHDFNRLTIESLCLDKQNRLLIGYNNGLARLDPITGSLEDIRIECRKANGLFRPDIHFKSLVCVGNGVVYGMTIHGSLAKLNPDESSAHIVPWVPDPRTGKTPRNIVQAESDGKLGLWIAASNGFFHWNPTSCLSEIPPALIELKRLGNKGFIRDSNGVFWLPTQDAQLISFDPRSGRKRAAKLENRSGRLEIQRHQHALDHKGQVLFASRKGIIHFYPAEVRFPEFPRRPVITRLEVLGKPEWIGRGDAKNRKVVISENDKFITVYFVSPNTLKSDFVSYSYRLSGLRSEWINVGSRTAIDFSRLAVGTYTFQVKTVFGATGDSALSEPLTLVIEAPFFSRPKTQIALALGFLLLIGGLVAVSLRRTKKQNKTLQEQILHRTNAESALAESEARLTTAFSNMPGSIWVRSPDGTIITANPQFQEKWGAIIGSKEMPQLLPLVFREHWESDHKRAMQGETIQRTLDYEHSDCNCRTLRVIAPIHVHGQVTGTVGVDIDVSALRQSEKEREDLERQLRHTQKLEAVGKLAGGVAHDFNNILTAITGHAELIKMGLHDGAQSSTLEEDVDGVINSSNRAARLTQQLLTFGKKNMVVPQVFAPEPVLNDMKMMLSRILRESITFRINHKGATGCIHADPGQFEQIILNLVVNSSDAMPNGGELSVTLSDDFLDSDSENDKKRPAVLLRIQDNGSGMSAEVLQRAFEPYFSTKAFGEGTGLGLSTVHGIVERLGGRITISSEVDKGTVVEVRLPQHSPTTNRPLNKVEILQPKDQHSPSRPATILVCEDDPSVRLLTCRILRNSGFDILEAESPSIAIDLCHKLVQPPQLLLTDVIMPTMDGITLATKLRAEYPHLMVLLVSGYTFEAMKKNELPTWCWSFLHKPFTANQLTEQIQLLLQVELEEAIESQSSHQPPVQEQRDKT